MSLDPDIYQILDEREERLKKLISDELNKFSKNILVELKNMILEQQRDFSTIINKQNNDISMNKRDLEALKETFILYKDATDSFKKEAREQLVVLNADRLERKGSTATIKWIIGGGIVGWLGLIITLLKFFSVT